jgi:RNA recognition motif-containing protein
MGSNPKQTAFKSDSAQYDSTKIERTIHVKNIGLAVNEEMFLSVVQSFGTVTNYKLCGDGSIPVRFAFVEFSNVAEAQVAVGALPQINLGAPANLSVCRSRTAILTRPGGQGVAVASADKSENEAAGRTIHIGKLDSALPEEMLKEHFEKHAGSVTKVALGGDGNLPSRFGFVEFVNAEDAQKAVANLNKTVLGAYKISIRQSTTAINRPGHTTNQRGKQTFSSSSQGAHSSSQSRQFPEGGAQGGDALLMNMMALRQMQQLQQTIHHQRNAQQLVQQGRQMSWDSTDGGNGMNAHSSSWQQGRRGSWDSNDRRGSTDRRGSWDSTDGGSHGSTEGDAEERRKKQRRRRRRSPSSSQSSSDDEAQRRRWDRGPSRGQRERGTRGDRSDRSDRDRRQRRDRSRSRSRDRSRERDRRWTRDHRDDHNVSERRSNNRSRSRSLEAREKWDEKGEEMGDDEHGNAIVGEKGEGGITEGWGSSEQQQREARGGSSASGGSC